jgi:hypothetical protein
VVFFLLQVVRYRGSEHGLLWLDSSTIHSYACSLVHSELSWWGSLHLHVTYLHYCSHSSVDHLIKQPEGKECNMLQLSLSLTARCINGSCTLLIMAFCL